MDGVPVRRKHWDDMLVNGIPIPDHAHLSDAELYAIIAAVEDWQRQRGPSLTEFIEMDDAIKRVRELCQSARVSISKGCLCHDDECSRTCGRGKPLAWNLNPDDILRILDGDA